MTEPLDLSAVERILFEASWCHGSRSGFDLARGGFGMIFGRKPAPRVIRDSDYRVEVIEGPTYAERIKMRRLDGMDWFEAPAPGKRHVCWPQLIAQIGLDVVRRCACGAISRDGKHWLERNSR